MNHFKTIIIIFFSLLSSISIAQDKTEISIITCSAGDELYSAFGHTAIRIKDLSKNRDDVFNFGTFNFSEPNFYIKFMRGKLNYYLDVDEYKRFIRTYVYEHREVREQVLNLTEDQTNRFIKILEKTYESEDRYYKYDFLYNNCSTKIWELIKNVVNNDLIIDEESENKTFRNAIHSYLLEKQWAQFGIDIALGMPTDKIMNKEEENFLPELLENNLNHTYTNGNKIVKSSSKLIPGADFNKKSLHYPLIASILLLITFFAVAKSKKLKLLRVLYGIFHVIILLIIIVVLLLWFWTDHDATQVNQNLIWLIPALAFLFFRKWLLQNDKKATYIGFGILIVVSFMILNGLLNIAIAPLLIISLLVPTLLLKAGLKT